MRDPARGQRCEPDPDAESVLSDVWRVFPPLNSRCPHGTLMGHFFSTHHIASIDHHKMKMQ